MKLNIIFWCEKFYPTIGGTEISLYRQIKQLFKDGANVSVISHDENGKHLQYNKNNNFKMVQLDNNKKDIFKALEIIRNINKKSLVYISGIFRSNPLPSLMTIKEVSKDIDTVLRIPTSGDLDELSDFSLADFLGNLAGFICLDNAIEKEIRKYVQHPIVFLHKNGIPIDDFSKNKFSKNGDFLFIGRLSKTKGVSVLIDAWKKYKTKGGSRKLIIYGPKKPGYVLRELKDNAFLYRHGIEYRGPMQDVWRHFKSSRAIIIPSLKEGHSNVMLEAMAAGIPVIASNISGLRGDLLASEAGVLFNKENSDQLACELLKFEDGVYDLVKMSKKGHRFIKNNRTLKHSIKNLHKMFQKIGSK